jgi:hypothetical protein
MLENIAMLVFTSMSKAIQSFASVTVKETKCAVLEETKNTPL